MYEFSSKYQIQASARDFLFLWILVRMRCLYQSCSFLLCQYSLAPKLQEFLCCFQKTVLNPFFFYTDINSNICSWSNVEFKGQNSDISVLLYHRKKWWKTFRVAWSRENSCSLQACFLTMRNNSEPVLGVTNRCLSECCIFCQLLKLYHGRGHEYQQEKQYD